jgi:uncharacterized membrane protein YjjP (DUF1212 family)
MTPQRLRTKLLLQAGRLLLEYNESTEAIHRTLTATARALTDKPCHVVVAYRGVAVSLGGKGTALEPVRELRYNMAVQARVHEVLEQVRRGTLDPAAALDCLGRVEADTPRHPRWLAALFLGASAAGLAGLLGADAPAAAVAGLASGLGLMARQELGRRHFSLLALPLTAALIGAVLGGVAIRLGWTRSPELVLIVPALMLVPGPHLINGLLDLIDNQLPMSLARFGLATGILLACVLGIGVGAELTLWNTVFPEPGPGPKDLGLVLGLVRDVVLAGIVTCGFAVFYNTPWRQLWMAALGGMAGHGVRFLAPEAHCQPEAATFLGGLTVGVIAVSMARFSKTPVAVIAFAGAVTMIPGLTLYRALGGAVQLARSPGVADPTLVTETLGNALQGCLVVSGLALGLVLGTRAVLTLARRPDSPAGPHAGPTGDQAARRAAAESEIREPESTPIADD